MRTLRTKERACTFMHFSKTAVLLRIKNIKIKNIDQILAKQLYLADYSNKRAKHSLLLLFDLSATSFDWSKWQKVCLTV